MKRRFISVILSGAIITSTAASVMAQDYVVKKGDTLYSIAKNFGTTYQTLAEINNIENPNIIFPNQVLKTAETAQVMPSKDKTEEVLSVKNDNGNIILNSIDTEFSETVMDKIASLGDNPDVGNRSSGSKAERQAADYLFNTMKEIGLSNVTEDKFTADTWSFEKARIYISDDEYISLGGYATTLVSNMEDTEIVYGGRGTADDLKDLDVKDKLVLIEIDQHNDWWINHPAYQAYLKGAKAVIAYNDHGYAQYDDTTIGVQDICGPDYAPALGTNKEGFEKLKKLIDENNGTAKVKLDVKSVVTKDGSSQNLWGEIPGKSDETIMIIAHYDGYFHSAFDDASGAATVMGIAKAVIDSGYKPEKTIRFVFHGAEEWGKSGVEYDWAKGAYEQITNIHPEWAEDAFALLNIDGMYAISGQKDFALATVTELRDYTENAISDVIKEYPNYSVIVKSPTSTGTEDFSYSQAGVPAIVASDVEFEDSNYDQNIYHSTMDSKLYGFNPEVFKMVHEIFTTLLFDLDNTAVRPMNFTAEINALEESLDTSVIPADSEIFESLEKAKEAAEKLDAKTAQYNREGIENSAEYNKKLYEIFKEMRQNLVSFTWETEIVFPTEQSQNNIAALKKAIIALNSGDGDYAYDECLSNVDYNWYAYEFEKEAFYFQSKRIRDNAVGTWGEGLILNPGENLYDVIAFLKENYGNENTDYTEVISVLEKALENQKNYLNTAVENENIFLKNITEKMNGI